MNEPIFQRVTIVGAGAIGGWLGVRLAQAGCTVSAIARGETLANLQREGLRLRSGDSEQTVSVQAVSDGSGLGPQDLVIVAVKAPALAHVAPLVAPLLGPKTVVLTAMNGVP
jgi:2-dehydropantoate 2-reductase